jgi:hypothetical protein
MVVHLRIRRERSLVDGSLGGGRSRDCQGGNGNERKQRPHVPLPGFCCLEIQPRESGSTNRRRENQKSCQLRRRRQQLAHCPGKFGRQVPDNRTLNVNSERAPISSMLTASTAHVLNLICRCPDFGPEASCGGAAPGGARVPQIDFATAVNCADVSFEGRSPSKSAVWSRRCAFSSATNASAFASLIFRPGGD